MSKSYNALTGAEIKKVILGEVEKSLDNYGVNSPGVTYPLVSWEWSLTIRQQAGETAERKIEASGVGVPGEELPPPADNAVKLCHCGKNLHHIGAHLKASVIPAQEEKVEEGRLDDALAFAQTLKGGSNRFHHNPPSPTEVRETEKLPQPEG